MSEPAAPIWQPRTPMDERAIPQIPGDDYELMRREVCVVLRVASADAYYEQAGLSLVGTSANTSVALAARAVDSVLRGWRSHGRAS
jgi:hypothetical protein